MKNILIILITFFTYFGVNAQSHVFKVLSTKGEISVKRGNKWMPINRGAKIYEGSRIRIKHNGYMGMVHKSGKPITLKKDGEYDINTLSTKINIKTSSFANKYARYIANRMSGANTKRVSGHMLASVNRGIQETLHVNAPAKTMVRDGLVVISWDSIKGVDEYTVTVYNFFDEVISVEKTSKNIIELNLKGYDSKYNGNYLFDVKATNKKKSAKRNIFITTEENIFYDDLTSSLDLNNALDNLYCAQYLEDKELYLDAISYYKNAIKLEPNIEDFKTEYQEFLKRNNIK